MTTVPAKIIEKLLLTFLVLALVSACEKKTGIVDRANIQLEEVQYLKIYGSFCDVEVIGTDDSTIEIVGEIQGQVAEGSYQIMHKVLAETAKVWIDEPVTKLKAVVGKITVKIPRNARVKITNENGDVYVSDMAGEKVKIKTTSGDVVVEKIETYVQIKSQSGDLKVNELTGPLKIKSESGDQLLINITGDIKSSSASGDVSLTNIEGELDIQSTSGDLKGQSITLTNHSDFETTSGDIKFRLKNPVENLEFKLHSNTGDITVGDILGGRDFEQPTGGLRVTATSDAGDQSFQ